MQQRSLYDFPQLLDLLLASTHITVRHIGLILDLHHSDSGIDLRGQGNMNLIFVTVHTDSHALLDIGGRNGLGQLHHELGKLLNIDDVLGIVRVSIDDLCATRHLQRLFVLQRLLVGGQIPESRSGQTSVTLLDPCQFVYLLDCLLNVLLDGLDRLVVLALTLEGG